jgi:hypothetical protein
MIEIQAMPENAGSVGTATVNLNELIGLAARGLPQMMDPQSHLFCYKLKKTPNGLEREGVSHRYTMMTLLGLHRLEAMGHRSLVDIQSVLEVLLRDTKWNTGAGDLGLLLWTCAEVAPHRLPEVCDRTHPAGALKRFADGRYGYTMEVAWFLAGVARCFLVAPDDFADLAQDALEAFEVLKRNCGAGGIFGHLAKNRSMAGRLRGRIGSFADQVYPICALSYFAKAFQNDEALQMALQTAQTICRHQGPLGQWWWHYDSSTGDRVGRYAVYSVHQHAMGPMALFSIGEVADVDFSQPIKKGLSWLSGHNELQMNFLNESHPVIWRSIYLSRNRAYFDTALSLLGVTNDRNHSTHLRIRYECRPYELGWLLYAFAGREWTDLKSCVMTIRTSKS